MTGKAGWMMGSMLAAALLANGVAMAQTQPRYGYPSAEDQQAQDDRYSDQDSYSSDEANAAQQQNRANDEDFSDVAGTEPSPLPQQQQQREEDDRRYGTRDDWRGTDRQDARAREEIAMTDACALAARDEAERDGGYAEVRQMEAPRENRGRFTIDGDVETRSGWRAQDGRVRHFTCTVANGRIEDLDFQRERAAR